MTDVHSSDQPPIRPLLLRVPGRGGRRLSCFLHGGTAEQVRRLLQTPPFFSDAVCVLDEAIAGVDEGRHRLLRALAHPQAAQRVLDSQGLLRELWRADRGLGPYPLLELLSEFEYNHAYHAAYRDHLVHQVRVWVLGLYLLHGLPQMLKALQDEVRGEESWSGRGDDEVTAEVLRRWKVTALWHDLGYVFEVQSAAEPLTLVQRSLEGLNDTFRTPLAVLLPDLLPAERESLWQQDDEQPLPSWPRPMSFHALTERQAKLWQQLAPAGHTAGLALESEVNGGLKPYLELCRAGDLDPEATRRPAFLDHGIAGALLLLRLFGFFNRYAGQVDRLLQEEPGLASTEQRTAVGEVSRCCKGSTGTVTAAARAIALHNLLPRMLEPGAAAYRGLNPKRFTLRLDSQPLAYLLALTDGLQDWDRPRFTAPQFPDDIGLIDQEVMLVATGDRIHLDYEMDEEEAVQRFGGMRRDLTERLHGIDQLLSRGVDPKLTAPPLPEERVVEPQLAPSQVDLGPYLEAVLAECGTVELRGIMPSGKTRKAVTLPIEEIYAPLQVEGGIDDLWQLLVNPTLRTGRMAGFHELDETPDEQEKRQVLLLVGDPGSGKSTFLRMTAAVLAHALRDEDWALEHAASRAFLDASSDELPVPVFIRLSRLTEFLDAADRGRVAVDAPALLREYLEQWAESRSTGLTAADLESWLRNGKAVLLLDGLDEIPGRTQRERVERIISNAVAEGVYGACRFCLTSRPLRDEGYHQALLPRRIDGLSDAAIEHFLGCWADCVSRSGAAPNQDLQAYTADLLAQARAASPAIRAMLRNPLMLTCLAVIHWNERRLPEQRAELLDAIVTWLLRARTETDDGEGSGEHRRRRVFQALALAMHCHSGGRVRELPLAEAASAVSSYLPGDSREQRLVDGRQLLEREMLASGIVTPAGRNSLQLWHLSFQEFLVADLLAGSTEAEWPVVLTPERLADPAWREVVLLLAGLLGNTPRAQALLRLVLEPAAAGTLADKARCYGLARAIVQDLRPYQFVPEPKLGLADLGREVLHIFTPAAVDVPLPVRVEAAEALGRAGDPRLQEDNWVGTSPGLCFGKYPVTVQDFARFVDDGGYDPEGFGAEWLEGWHAGIDGVLADEEWKWFWDTARSDRGRREPGLWNEQLATPNRPVVNVSWFEADAYCRWLSQRWPPEEWSYRLPSKEEWEHAARGAAGNDPYPWGKDDPGKGDAALANYDAAKIGKPSPVGLFPRGAADWGETGALHDMAGNVWEWCSNELGNNGKSKRGGLLRPLRGGAYWYDATGLEVAYRYWHLATYWYDLIGFRVVRCRARSRPPVDC